ncbi:hypothetical protein AZF37_02285 [endosymbiont 'TC1' of Trimyema compressum]|uniref:isoprenyl transferase n=1 Tax=endosymbiont 'TC1' of Trimyema compressum TaxID=243899 RepID=UPI0007F1629D|nr:isoprenyl transferase [endosymbiont 'TC1' of Trimyema compressum]AMP20152.1 hypothetical protein AZF37_02285 [endosymbiont 'TC1' of Trimyema compressum]
MNANKLIPEHIAIVMDGNGRWAKKRGLTRVAGHKEGVNTLRKIVESCGKLGVDYLTVYAFSTENWKRPEKEVTFLMGLLKQYVKQEVPFLIENNVRLKFLGSREGLKVSVLKAMDSGEEQTKNQTGLTFNIAFNYGSRLEIKDSVRAIAQLVSKGKINPNEINETLIENYLYTAGMPDPSLLIRTSREMRLSNFLLWQLAYTEFYITDILWPDFSEQELLKAIDSYGSRNRRFGGI